MKRILISAALSLVLNIFNFAQVAYYDAVKLKNILNNDTIYWQNSDAIDILHNYSKEDSTLNIALEFIDNPFIKIDTSGSRNQSNSLAQITSLSVSKLSGLDVSSFSQGLSQFMIERAKAELNAAFFDQFKNLTQEHDEVALLFPITTNRLTYLLSYQYTEMINQLREAFHEDLGNLPDNMIRFMEESKDFNNLRDSIPDFIIAINSFKLVRQVEYLSPPDFIHQLPSITNTAYKASKTHIDSVKIENFEAALKLASLFSESIRADTSENRNWVSAQDFYENILKDSIASNIYLGLLYQQIKNANVKINDLALSKTLKEEKNIVWYKQRVDEFIYLTNKVDLSLKEIKETGNTDNKKVTNSQVHSYIGTTIDIAYFGNRFVEKFGDKSYKIYLAYAENANAIYQYTYEQKYSSAILETINLLEKIVPFQTADPALVKKYFNIDAKGLNLYLENAASGKKMEIPTFISTNKIPNNDKKVANYAIKHTNLYLKQFCENSFHSTNNTFKQPVVSNEVIIDSVKIYATLQKKIAEKEKSYKWIKQLTTYGIFMANMVEAQTPADVSNLLTSTALPTGSSSIKKNSKFNIAINGYLGVVYRINTSDTVTNAWKSNWSVTAPVGLTFSTGFKRGGSLSLMGVLLDVGAIIDYQLTSDNSSIESKITLGNIFSPGGYLVYGMAWNLPVSIGIGAQYGPGLFSIDNKDNSSIINSPNWRVGAFIAVDIPMFNIYNNPKRKY